MLGRHVLYGHLNPFMLVKKGTVSRTCDFNANNSLACYLTCVALGEVTQYCRGPYRSVTVIHLD